MVFLILIKLFICDQCHTPQTKLSKDILYGNSLMQSVNGYRRILRGNNNDPIHNGKLHNLDNTYNSHGLISIRVETEV